MNTLQLLHKQWIPKLELASRLFLIVGLLLSFILAYTGVLELPIGALCSFGMAFLVDTVARISLFHFVKCPHCHKNLAKFKNGKNMPIKQVYSSFEKCLPCRHCGRAPS
ncbi:hypothetical protein [Jeongeupia naejangsanensis]|uniref:Uncharacterized protein n=1 Tax=Jeongeupia naejangsanensis TaxID=613195 RepID=A0ABS2BMW5_9NEIS|nr:hypothetical protein [Jeongeupia naejangsanensis]MBM3116943.1 hypothetical protein [Jeongeupia naejangsanensis]